MLLKTLGLWDRGSVLRPKAGVEGLTRGDHRAAMRGVAKRSLKESLGVPTGQNWGKKGGLSICRTNPYKIFWKIFNYMTIKDLGGRGVRGKSSLVGQLMGKILGSRQVIQICHNFY